MRRTELTSQRKAAVRVTAVFVILLATAVWAFLAFFTTNAMETSDYAGYSTTKLIASSEDKLTDSRFYGVAFTAEKGKCNEKLKQIADAKKVPFVMLPANKKEAKEIAEECLDELSSARLYFCSENREALEALLTETSAVYCLLLTPSSFSSLCGAYLGYNCALPFSKVTEEAVATLHKKDHLSAATGIASPKDLDACRALKIDFAFTTDDFK